MLLFKITKKHQMHNYPERTSATQMDVTLDTDIYIIYMTPDTSTNMPSDTDTYDTRYTHRYDIKCTYIWHTDMTSDTETLETLDIHPYTT